MLIISKQIFSIAELDIQKAHEIELIYLKGFLASQDIYIKNIM
jgi:hypothetical protein